MLEVMQGDVRNSGGGGGSECGTGRVLQDRLNQLHEGLASKEKAHKVCLMDSFADDTLQSGSCSLHNDSIACGSLRIVSHMVSKLNSCVRLYEPAKVA